MTRLAAFLSGIALGAVLMALLVYGLWRAPSIQLSVEWPLARTWRTEASPPVASPPPALRYEESIEPPAPSAPAPVEPVEPAEPEEPEEPAESSTIAVEPAESTPGTEPSDAVATPPSPQLSLLIPVAGMSAIALYDTFSQARGTERAHEAIDIMAPRGTAVIAAESGRVAKLFTSAQGGLTVYQFDTSGRYALYYAHLDAYAPGLKEGDELERGDPIGTVGSTGNASPDGPHLHFAVFLLGPERRWWQGTAVNPYPLLER